MVEYLIEEGTDIKAATANGETALHIAASRNRTKIITILIDSGADPFAKDRDGKLPIDYAKAPEAKELLKEYMQGEDAEKGKGGSSAAQDK